MGKITNIDPSEIEVGTNDPVPVTVTGTGFSTLRNRNRVSLLYLTDAQVKPEHAFVDKPPTYASQTKLKIPMQFFESILETFPDEKKKLLKVRVIVIDDDGKEIADIVSDKDFIKVKPKPKPKP